MYIGFGSLSLELSSNYSWMIDPWRQRQIQYLLENSKIERGRRGTDQQLLSIIHSSGSLDGKILVFLHHHHLFSFFPGGDKHFSIWFSLMTRERRNENNLGQTTAIYLLEPGRGASFCEHSSAWGVLESILHPNIKPPYLSWFFFLFFPQFESSPFLPFVPRVNGGKGVRRIQGGGRWSSLAGKGGGGSLSTYLNLARFRNIWNWKFLPSSDFGVLACLLLLTASNCFWLLLTSTAADATLWTKILRFGNHNYGNVSNCRWSSY